MVGGVDVVLAVVRVVVRDVVRDAVPDVLLLGDARVLLIVIYVRVTTFSENEVEVGSPQNVAVNVRISPSSYNVE